MTKIEVELMIRTNSKSNDYRDKLFIIKSQI